MKILTTANPKLDKSVKFGFLTAALHLAPSTLSGVMNTCAAATAGCKAACLNTAGRGGIAAGGTLTAADVESGARTNGVQAARIRRTRELVADRPAFLNRLAREISAHVRKARGLGLTPAIRLNATSDLRWERIRFDYRGAGGANVDGVTLLELFPDVQFYDYTKLANRRGVPANYHLTFSRADGNEWEALNELDKGNNIAVVFRDVAARDAWTAARLASGGVPVIDGDEHDLRFLDPRGVVVGLYAKGPAKRDTSGFVVDAPDVRKAA